MSWHFNFFGRIAAVRAAVQNVKGMNEQDTLHIDAVRPSILAIIDSNNCVAINVTASGHRDSNSGGSRTLSVVVNSASGYVE